MQIFLSGVTREQLKSTIVYDCTPDTKVYELRDFIKTRYQYPSDVYILKFNGKILDDRSKTFQDCGMKDLSTVRFVVINTVNFNTTNSYLRYTECLDNFEVDCNN